MTISWSTLFIGLVAMVKAFSKKSYFNFLISMEIFIMMMFYFLVYSSGGEVSFTIMSVVFVSVIVVGVIGLGAIVECVKGKKNSPVVFTSY